MEDIDFCSCIQSSLASTVIYFEPLSPKTVKMGEKRKMKLQEYELMND